MCLLVVLSLVFSKTSLNCLVSVYSKFPSQRPAGDFDQQVALLLLKIGQRCHMGTIEHA